MFLKREVYIEEIFRISGVMNDEFLLQVFLGLLVDKFINSFKTGWVM